MPSEMTGEPKEAKRPRILKLGKANNIIQWTEEMKTSISILCGGAGNFLTTNVRHGSTIPREEGYLPVIQPALPALPAALVTKLCTFVFEHWNKQV
jgi:hypothetical protein